ncbi:hypothetical protein HW555_007900 [Spodoptera exigua]|uniref:Uncharacterized protein n=1 Tax=Spodoptera exigua TaxID=7107 RepID=A0A835GFW4_SPOEX|nr:hypothetical protein HW555_007900 [Spodoptera exigua]
MFLIKQYCLRGYTELRVLRSVRPADWTIQTVLGSAGVGTRRMWVYSSFWAPLYDRRILNYRVDARFQPDAAQQARGQYAARYGYRGEKLIADIGNGKGLTDEPTDTQIYGDVKFQYT